MKKAMWFLIISVLFVGSVSAKQLTDEDIKANSIVIGTHLYEYGVSNADSGYTGIINTKFAMLGAASISSDTVTDMKIYYKFANGFWIDYLSRTEVTIPDSFKICYINGTFTGDSDCERGSGEIPGDENIVNVTFKASDYNETKIVPVKKGATISPDNAPDLKRNLGFKLDFWSKEGEETAFDFTTPINEDITLEVNWKPIQYKIYYHSNFGEDVTKEVACNYASEGSKCTLKGYLDVLADNDFVGNEFEGWSLTPIRAELISEDKTMDDIIGDVEAFHLYAIWKLNSYKLTYNDGTETPQSLTCVYNNVCSLEGFRAANNNGYLFDHWFFEVRDGDNVVETVVPQKFINLTTENTTIELKAAYKPYDYKINYNLDGGVLGTANPGAINITNSDGLAIENVPIKTGYTFRGWMLEDATADNYVELTKAADSNVHTIKLKSVTLNPDENGIKVKAKWEENTIALKLRDDKDNAYVDAEGNGIIINCNYENRENCEITYELESREDETFIGWKADGIINPDNKAFSNAAFYTEPGRELNVHSAWENKDRFNIEYKLDGGNFVDKARPVLTYAKGINKVQLPEGNTVSKTGYTFGGWIKYDTSSPAPAAEGEEPVEPTPITELTSPNGDVKLIAKWNPITYTVKLHNGDVETDIITCTYDVACSLNDHHEAFNKTNFIGWGKDADTLEYGDNTEVKNLTSTQGAVVKLYAVRGNYHNVSFYLDGGTLATPISFNDVISVGNKNKDMTVDLTGVTPTKEGYNFVGWLNGTNTVSGEVNITSDTLFIAKWEKKEYTVKLYFGPDHSSNRDITVKYGEKVLASDTSGIDTTGKWISGTTEIANLAAELENPVTDNKEYKRIYNVQLLDKDNTKNVEVIAGEKAIDKFTDLNVLNGKWFIDDATTSNSDLKKYLTDTAIVKDSVITKAKTVTFIDNTGTVSEFDVKYNGKLNVAELTAAVTDHDWYLGDTLIKGSQLAVHFGGTNITEDINYIRAYTITFDDTTSNKYTAKYNEKFDKTKISAEILSGQWYLEDSFTNLENYFDNNKIVGDIVFSKVYSVFFFDSVTAGSPPSPKFVKYNSNLAFDGLTEDIKNSTWIVGNDKIDLEDYLRNHPISSNVAFYKAYSVKLEYNGGPKEVYVKVGERADDEFTAEELSGYWLNGDTEIANLKDHLANHTNTNLTFTKLYTITLEYDGKTSKDVARIAYNTSAFDKFTANGIDFNTAPYNGAWIIGDYASHFVDLSAYLNIPVENDVTLYRAYKVTLESNDDVSTAYVKEGDKAYSRLQDKITSGDIWFNGDTEVEVENFLKNTPVNSDIVLKKAYNVTLAHSGTQEVFKVPYNEKAISKITGIDFTTEPYNGKWKNNSDIINPGDLENYLNNLTVSGDITISTIVTLTLEYNGGPKNVTVEAGRVNPDEVNGIPLDSAWFDGSTLIENLETELPNINSDLTLVKGYSVTLSYEGNDLSKDKIIVPYNTVKTRDSWNKFKANGIDFDTEPYNGEWLNGTDPVVSLEQCVLDLIIVDDIVITKKTTP